MTQPHPKLIELVESMGFQQHQDKANLYQKDVDVWVAVPGGDVVARKAKAYIDFRNTEKGSRYSSDKDVNPDDIPELINFKERRDAFFADKLIEKPNTTTTLEKQNAITTDIQLVQKGAGSIQPAPASYLTQDIIKDASKIAKTLADVIDKTKMFKLIGNKKYVYVDGWETLGAMMHCRSEIIQVDEYKDGYKAFAVIYDRFGNILSKGSAICTRAEKNWKDRDEYAIYSMAQTRALGKAYRLGLSWVMSLAGYESTPAEEVD